MPLTQIRQVVINEQFSGVVPIGGIIMYKGAIADLPSGWSFCNGSNGTPDLRDRFIIGAFADSGGQANTNVTGSTTKNGGSKDAIAVSHTHTVTDPGHFHAVGRGLGASGTGGDAVLSGSAGYNSQSKVTGISVDTAGQSGANQNLPPYYALAFIMRIS